MSRKKANSRNSPVCVWLAFYYLCFIIWVQFPGVHSQLDDLYQGRVTSLVILGGIHNHPADEPFSVFDNHSITLLQIERCAICSTYTSSYTPTRIIDGFFCYCLRRELRQSFSFHNLKPAATNYHKRAPPSCLL
ncbi:MAG: hypothetical protein JXQ83_05240 [Candidatus Glassbacteria bacterium]|nr:hypothetical protein [Candidatus Glassbacteria bacterium]